MVSLFRPRRQITLARGLLGLWLFVLAQGIANACLLQTAAPGDVQAVHAHADEYVHEADDHAEALCVDACDRLQDSVPTKGGDHDPGHAVWSAGPLWPRAWLAALPSGVVASEAGPVHGPPPRIRFLRLSL